MAPQGEANPVRRDALASDLGAADIQAAPEPLVLALPDEGLCQAASVRPAALVRQAASARQVGQGHARREHLERLQSDAEHLQPQDAFLPAPQRAQNPEARAASAVAQELTLALKAQLASEHLLAVQEDAEHLEPQAVHRALMERKAEQPSEPPGALRPEPELERVISAALRPELEPP